MPEYILEFRIGKDHAIGKWDPSLNRGRLIWQGKANNLVMPRDHALISRILKEGQVVGKAEDTPTPGPTKAKEEQLRLF